MTKKISEVTIKITGKGIKAVNKDIDTLLANIEESTAAAKGLNTALGEGGRADAVLSRIADSTERTEREFKKLQDTSSNTLKLMEAQLTQTAFGTEEARESAEKLGSQYRSTSRSTTKLNNSLKDTNRRGTNQVRTFSKMARSAGKLTIIYAVIAANVFALSEAFRIMNQAASVERLSEVSSVMSNDLGISIKSTANALYEATDAAISYQEALKLAAASAAYGFDTAQMEKLALVAKRASVVLGVDMQDALRRVTRGIAKQEVELLDELGLTIRMNEAFSKYAATHGLAAKSLTTFQRQQAFTNEVIKKSEEGLGSVDKALASTEWEKFGAEVSTSTNELLQAASNSDILTKSLKFLRETMQSLRGESIKGIDMGIANSYASANTRAGRRKGRGEKADASEFITTPGAEQLSALKEDDLRGAVASQVILNAELVKAKNLLEETVKYETLRVLVGRERIRQGSKPRVKTLTDEYVAVKLLVSGLEELEGRAGSLSTLDSSGADRTNEALKELGALGKTFTNELDTYSNKLFGVADASLQTQIDSINDAANRAAESSAGKFDKSELLSRAKTTAAELAGKAQSVADYQKLALTARSKEIDIIKSGIQGEAEALALANIALTTAKDRLVILNKEDTSGTVLIKQLMEKADAEEKIRSIKESQLLREREKLGLASEFASRNDNAIKQATKSLSLAESNLAAVDKSKVGSAETLRILKGIVTAKRRALDITEEQDVVNKAMQTRESVDLSSQFTNRNESTLTQDTASLEVAKSNLAIAKASKLETDETVASLKNIVTAKERALIISKEQEEKDKKAAYFAVQSQLASNVGTLDSGMGSVASGLVAAGEGWDVLGNKASSSAERISAAYKIAGGYQAALGGLISSAAGMVTSNIDAEIAAVKSSGLSKEAEEKKVKQLQKRKIKEQEKYTKASILLNTAMGVAGALAMQPWTPANFVFAGITAAAGLMAYQQASNTASSQLSSLGGGGSSANMAVTVGKETTPRTDVSKSASGSERAQMLGDRGVYGRASAGSMKANTPYLTSESGRELVIPKTDSKIINSSDTEALLGNSRGNTFAPKIYVNALDSQSLEERMPDILSMLQEQAEQQGFSLTK
jgi:hypothetical protein